MRIAAVDLRAVTPYYDAGLCLALQRAGARIELFSSPPRLEPDLYRRLGVRTAPSVLGVVERWRLARSALRKPLRAVQLVVNFLSTWTVLLLRPPDVLHVQWLAFPGWPGPEVVLMRLARARGSRIAFTVHNVRPHEGTGRGLCAVYRAPDVLFCHTEEAATELVSCFQVDPRRIVVVHEGAIVGAQATRSPVPRHGGPVVLFCGVMRPYKGASVLLDAWRLLEDRVSTGRLVIAGGGLRDELQRIDQGVEARGLRRVTLRLASLSDAELAQVHDESDIVVLPYLHASGSEALVRAMTVGLPVVASATGGLGRWVLDGQTGVLVPPGDALALAKALEGLLQSSHQRARMGEQARRHVMDTLSWERAAAIALVAFTAPRSTYSRDGGDN